MDDEMVRAKFRAPMHSQLHCLGLEVVTEEERGTRTAAELKSIVSEVALLFVCTVAPFLLPPLAPERHYYCHQKQLLISFLHISSSSVRCLPRTTINRLRSHTAAHPVHALSGVCAQAAPTSAAADSWAAQTNLRYSVK